MANAETPSIDREERSRIRSLIVFILCTIPAAAALAYGGVDSLALGVMFILVAVVVFLWMLDSRRSGSFHFSTNLLQLPLVGLILLAGIHLLPFRSVDAAAIVSTAVANTISLDPYATRFFLIQLVVFFVFFAAALTYVPGGSRPKKIAIGIIVFGSLLAFFGILQRLSMPESIYGLRPTPQAIPFGPFVNQHHFAALMQMTSGIALGFLFGTSLGRDRKLIVAFAAAVMGMAIVFTGSRGGLIGYLCVVSFAAIASFVRTRGSRREDPDIGDRRKRNLLVATAACGLVLLVLGSVLLLGGQDSLLRGIGLQSGQTDVSSGRLHFWQIAWQIFLAHPIIGAGFDSFGVAFTRLDTWNGFYRVERAHNDYLQMLADGGVIGFACVVSFVALFLKKGIAAISSQKDRLLRSIVTGAFAGCLGILVHSFFDFPLRTPANAFFFLLLVVLAVGNGEASGGRSST